MGGISCSDECIPLSGQRPFTISSQKKTYTDFSFVSYLSHTFVTFPQRLQVMFKFMDGAQTLSRICLFAVLYFIIILVVVVFLFLFSC